MQEDSFAHRAWKRLDSNPNVTSIQIETSTRKEGKTYGIFVFMFSSLKYFISQSVSVSNNSGLSDIRALVQVVDPETGEEIVKNNSRQKIIEGDVDIKLQKDKKTSTFISKSKVRLTSVSFHHNNQSFMFRISYYTPGEKEPIAVIASDTFQVFARRASVNNDDHLPKSVKRKLEKETVSAPTKKRKLIDISSPTPSDCSTEQEEDEHFSQEQTEPGIVSSNGVSSFDGNTNLFNYDVLAQLLQVSAAVTKPEVPCNLDGYFQLLDQLLKVKEKLSPEDRAIAEAKTLEKLTTTTSATLNPTSELDNLVFAAGEQCDEVNDTISLLSNDDNQYESTAQNAEDFASCLQQTAEESEHEYTSSLDPSFALALYNMNQPIHSLL